MPNLMILSAVLLSQVNLMIHNSDEGGFSVTVPALQLKEERKTVRTISGPREFLIASGVDRGVRYQVIVMAVSAKEGAVGAAEFLDGARDGLLKSGEGHLIREKDVKLGEITGREVVYSGTVPGVEGPGSGVARFFRADKFSYSVSIGMSTASFTPAEQARAQAFLDSFSRLREPKLKALEPEAADAGAVATLPALGPGPDKPKWQPFASKAGFFRVVMPSEPVERTQDVEMPSGKTKMVLAAASAAGTTYTVVRLTLPIAVGRNEENQFFDSNIAGIMDEVKGKLTSKKKIVLGGVIPGRDLGYEGKLPGDDRPMAYRARVFVSGRGLYTLTVAAPKGKLKAKDAQKFLESFALSSQPGGNAPKSTGRPPVGGPPRAIGAPKAVGPPRAGRMPAKSGIDAMMGR